MKRRGIKGWQIAAISLGGLATGIAIVTFATKAYAKERTYTPSPGESPLRPPPPGTPIPGAPPPSTGSPGVPAGPPGPLATRLAEILDDQDDDELLAARDSMPSHWWPLILAATSTPNDQAFVIVLNPIIVDIALMPDTEREALQSNLVSAVGLLDALAMKDLLLDAKNVAIA